MLILSADDGDETASASVWVSWLLVSWEPLIHVCLFPWGKYSSYGQLQAINMTSLNVELRDTCNQLFWDSISQHTLLCPISKAKDLSPKISRARTWDRPMRETRNVCSMTASFSGGKNITPTILRWSLKSNCHDFEFQLWDYRLWSWTSLKLLQASYSL